METLIAGALIGIVLGLTGAGGGVLAVPLLLVLGVPFTAASPVALAAVAIAASLGAVLALKERHVRYRAAGLMALAGIATTPLGIWLAYRLPLRALLLAFACVLAWVGVATWRRTRRGGTTAGLVDGLPCRINPATGRLSWTPRGAMVLSLLGAAAGTASGLLGVGGGFVIVPGLQRVSDVPVVSTMGTSLAVVALVSLWGVLTSAALGNLDTSLATRFAAGAVVGMLMGRHLARRLPSALLQRGFAILAGLVGAGLALKAVGS